MPRRRHRAQCMFREGAVGAHAHAPHLSMRTARVKSALTAPAPQGHTNHVNFMAFTTIIRDQIRELWERNHLFCGWFLRPDFTPRTDDDFVLCAKLLEKHGDRQTYVAVRKLKKCL